MEKKKQYTSIKSYRNIQKDSLEQRVINGLCVKYQEKKEVIYNVSVNYQAFGNWNIDCEFHCICLYFVLKYAHAEYI